MAKNRRKEALKPKESNIFWQKLPKPFFVLAPMANVTDSVFRSLFAKYGKPDVTWTEFVSADGLVSSGKDKLLMDLEYSTKERPIVAQLFSGHEDKMFSASKLVASLGFDGIDINMGCPDRAVEKQGGGAAMIKDMAKALAVLKACREGWKAGKKKTALDILPITIKTRLGYNKIDMEWIRSLILTNIPALTVHLRTRKEMSDVPAHWELMPDIVKMRDDIQAGIDPKKRTLIIGNGDVDSLNDARDRSMKYGCDGVMIGRGIFGKPWFFEKLHELRKSGKSIKDENIVADEKTPEFKLETLLVHSRMFSKRFCGKDRVKSFAVMKKHFKAYVNGFDGAKELRAKLMEVDDFKAVEKIITGYLRQ